MNMIVQQYQTRVLGPEEPVDYASIIRQSYPPQAIQQEPFVGFKVLCTDTQAYSTNPAERIRFIDANLGVLRGNGCIIRETSRQKPDGFWIISLPVPRSQVTTALNMSKLVPSNNMLCTIGKIQRINNDFICLRTRWDLTGTRNNQQLTFEDLTEISQLISLMYH